MATSIPWLPPARSAAIDARKWRWIQGILIVIAVAVIWIISSYVVQSVESNGISPLLLTYICNSLFIILIPISEYANSVRRAQRGPARGTVLGEEENEGSEDRGALTKRPRKLESKKKNAWTRGKIAKISLLICPFWFTAQLTFNLSLSRTSVSSNTIISSISSLFTFLLSVLFLKEQFTVLKLVSVLACVLGTAVVTVADEWNDKAGNGEDSLSGDLLCLLSAFIYAVYTCLLRQLTPSEEELDEDHEKAVTVDDGRDGADDNDGGSSHDRHLSRDECVDDHHHGLNSVLLDDMESLDSPIGVTQKDASVLPEKTIEFSTALLFGYIGLFNLLILAPVLGLLYLFKLSTFTCPYLKQLGLVITKGLLDNVLSDYLWARALLLTSPVAATTGLQLQIPISLVVDSVLEGTFPNIFRILGSAMVILGVFGITSPVLLSK